MLSFTRQYFHHHLCGNGRRIAVNFDIASRHKSSTPSTYPRSKLVTGSIDVLTLNPERMVEIGQNICDISAVSQLSIRFPLLASSQIIKKHRKPLGDLFYVQETRQQRIWTHKFPVPTKGVFYYHPSEPPLSSGIRFRICGNTTLASIQAGRDLLLPPTDYGEQTPWEIPLYNIHHDACTRLFKGQLLHDGLVDPIVIRNLGLFGSGFPNPLLALDTPFVVDLSESITRVTFLTNDAILRHTFLRLFSQGSGSGKIFSGKVRVRFVLSDRPEHRDDDLSLLLQYLDILTPVLQEGSSCDHIKLPVAREYLEKKTQLGNYEPWTLSLRYSQFGPKIASMFGISI